MTYLNYYIHGLKNYLVFEGRASRPEFWWFNLVLYSINLMIVVLGAALNEFSLVFETVATIMVWGHGLVRLCHS